MAMTSSQLMSSFFKVVTKTEGPVRKYTKVERRAFFQSSDGLIDMANSWNTSSRKSYFLHILYSLNSPI